MTLKQLRVAHRSYLREFDAAVVRRRANIKRVMANQIAARKRMRNPNEPSTKAARALKAKLLNTLYRAVQNKASNSRCGRFHKDKNGWWVGPSLKSKRHCRA